MPSPEYLMRNRFCFGKLEGNGTAYFEYGHVGFAPHGVITSYLNDNEVFWDLAPRLQIFNRRGSLSQIFSKLSSLHSTEVMRGRLLTEPVRHFLYRVTGLHMRTTRCIILISSHITYLRRSIPEHLITQLVGFGVPREDIIVVVNESDRDDEFRDDVRHIHVPHNAWEYSALLAASEMESDADYFFLLHDTCLVGPDFPRRLKEVDLSLNWDIISCTADMHHNIGFYSREFLHRERPFLSSSTSISKQEAIELECKSELRRRARLCKVLDTAPPRIGSPIPVYGGTPRNPHYLSTLDIHKFFYWDHSGGYEHPNSP